MLAIIHTENTYITSDLQIFYEFVWDMLLQTPLEGLDVRSSNNIFRDSIQYSGSSNNRMLILCSLISIARLNVND